MYRRVNLFWKTTVENFGRVSAYFCDGHKNNLRLQFRSSFKQIVLILNQTCSKKIFTTWNRKSEDHQIQDIQISLSTKFHPTQTILIFLTKVAWKENFRSKAEKVKTAIKFNTFKSVCVSNFKPNFRPNLSKKGIFRLKKETYHGLWHVSMVPT